MRNGLRRGKMKAMKSASVVPQPACKDGKAPKTIGDPVKPGVYIGSPKSLSMAANPAGEPGIE